MGLLTAVLVLSAPNAVATACCFSWSRGRGPQEEPCSSRLEAEAIEKELLEDYRFGRQQLIEIWGHASAMAVTKLLMGNGLVPARLQFPALSPQARQDTGRASLACVRC
ncbi:yjeF N-terminal domain-containing protein 3 isoform X3 [Chelonoidis abingdonii]|uniref:yjeF N-terminal domain-containing protein 3 isoform X3 n=1 Tax=Chelonoidis abingdonii TaxID=106734 RepID=UPI003F49A83E